MSDQPHAGQPGDTQAARNDGTVTLTLEELGAAIREQVAPLVNGAVKTHLKRWQDQQAETRTTQGDDADAAPSTGKGKDDDRVAQLQKQMQALAKERDEERARTAELKRDTALKAMLAERNFRNPDVTMAALKAQLKVEDGEYIHEGQDGVPVPLASFVDDFAKREPWMVGERGRPGGGAVGNSPGRRSGTPPIQPPEGLSGLELITWARENGQGGPTVPSVSESDSWH